MIEFNINLVGKNRIPGILLGILALVLLAISQYSLEPLPRPERRLMSPISELKHLTIGYKEVLADGLWIRTIQDFDYCEQEIAQRICKNESWLYSMLNLITDLSPNFYSAYYYGSLALSIVITDVDGAKKIYEKGIAQFPQNWKLQYYAAYHYIYEIKDNRRAADLLVMAGKNGAPAWVSTLAGRLYSDEGHLEMAEKVLEEMIESHQDPKLVERLRNKIDDMKITSQRR